MKQLGSEADVQVSLKGAELTEAFKKFLETYRSKEGLRKYMERIGQMIVTGQKSLIVDFMDLIEYDRALASMVLDNPGEAIERFSEAVKLVVERENPEYARKIVKFYPRFRNPPETHRIRDISSDYIGKLIAIEGIVTRVTKIDAKIVKATYRHRDPETGIHEFIYPDEGEIGERFEKPVYCPVCGKPGRFELLPEKSTFIDWQKIVVQEKPEEVPGGQIPRSIEIILTGDIVDVARPGDRVIVIGTLRVAPISSLDRHSPRALFSFYIDANNIEVQEKVLEEIEITDEDEKRIRELAKDPWIREKIIASIAPGIYGYWDIKEAIALLLLGGVQKILQDGTRIRGDIHVLLVGDPGTAKSQLLQFTSRLAPRGLYTSGKGSTAAGLTATVIRDKMTGEYYLEAGALVIADGGVACIDEIDKMREEDRSAIHEALEQQTVSIAKAGIVARLNAKSSVLAAGNPKDGRYDPTKPVSKNIDLPPTILSRFDLIFTIRDVPNTGQDRRLARHILGVHSEADKTRPLIDLTLLKKYISYARRYVRPQLTPEAARLIEEFYVSMRQSSISSDPSQPTAIAITPRQLEAIIRLTEAHARLSLKNRATVEDAEEAIRLMLVMLSKIGMDVESGRIDIDVIESGVSASKREKKRRFREFVFRLLEDVGKISISELVAKASEKGFEKEFAKEEIREMLRRGELYEPESGYVAKA